MIHAVEPLLNAQVFAVRTSSVIKPGPFIQADGLRDERVIRYPLAHGVSIPPRVISGILRQFSPVRPDGAPYLVKFVQYQHGGRSLNDLSGPQIMKPYARESLRIADVHGIIHLRDRNSCNAPSRLIRFER